MIGLAWRTVRARKTSLAGTFIALALGVALLSCMALTLASTIGAGNKHPHWFTDPDVVVAGNRTVSITSGSGEDRETQSVGTAESIAIAPALAHRLSTVDADVVVDYAGYGAVDGAPGDTVHPWSAASLHRYAWIAGGAPASPDQIVLTAPTRYHPGDRVTALTVAGPQAFTVSGVLSTSATAASYVTDPVAAQLAGGRIDAVALTGRAGGSAADLARTVKQVVGKDGSTQVLTGDDRRKAEPDPDGDKLVVAVSLLGTTCGLAGFVSIFVVAGTFGYAVAARRREFGLLRTAGATPRQVRRLVLGEALAVGVLASVAGGALGTVMAPAFAHWLARIGFAPAYFTAHFIFWPVSAAFGVGMIVALTGAWLAARRAGRVRPVEALRDAAVDRRPMTVGRWLVGLGALAGSVPLIGVFAAVHSADATAIILVVAMLLVLACAMLAPVLIPPLVWVFTAPLARSPGAIGMLARRSALAAVRRTASTAAPILVTVGIAGATLASLGTLNAAQQEAGRDRVTAPAMITASGAGLADPTVAAVRAVPGVTAAVPIMDTRVYVREAGDPEDWTGRYLPGPDASAVLNLPVVAGSLKDLTGTDTVAVPKGTWRLGDTASLWLGDSAPVRLRVVAVLADQLDLEQTALLPWDLRTAHTARPLATAVYLGLAPGTPLDPVRAAAATGGGTVIRTGDYLSAADAEQAHTNWLATVAVLGISLLYTGIAIANTLVMATGDRVRELATLRLSGATPGQALRMIGVEALLVTGVGVGLAAAVTAVTVAGMRSGLAGLAPRIPLVIPWQQVGAIAGACLVVAVLASLIPAALVLRRRPVELAGVRE